MYAVIEKNRIKISVTEFYNMAWYEKGRFLEGKEIYEIDYGRLSHDWVSRRSGAGRSGDSGG